jgi:hypothetical protein
MMQGVRGNNRHPRALAGEFDPSVERLVAKGRTIAAREDEWRSREVHSPTTQPHSLDAFQESEPATFDLKAGDQCPRWWARGRAVMELPRAIRAPGRERSFCIGGDVESDLPPPLKSVVACRPPESPTLQVKHV